MDEDQDVSGNFCLRFITPHLSDLSFDLLGLCSRLKIGEYFWRIFSSVFDCF